MGLCTIKRSSEFQRVRGGQRASNAFFAIETRLRGASAGSAGSPAPSDGEKPLKKATRRPGGATSAATDCTGPRFGFTVTRKIGNAVVRNRIRRRFKEALRSMPPGTILPGYDYVVVARPGVIEQPFAELSQTLATTIAGLHRPGHAHKGRDGNQRPGKSRPQGARPQNPGTAKPSRQERRRPREAKPAPDGSPPSQS